MKPRFSYLLILAVVLALFAAGCAVDNQPQPAPTPEPARQPTAVPEPSPEPAQGMETPAPDEEPKPAAQLKALLPDKEGYEWVYNGFAEYGHELELEEIKEGKGKIIYAAEGEVFDMSDGESDRDFSLSVDFIVTSDSLVQEKNGEMMMDVFSSMILVQLPLQEGHTWNQSVEGEDGDQIELKCTIEKAEEQDGARKYTIVYQDQSSPYFERRVITEGIGVTEFTRLFRSEAEGQEDFEISYWLYGEASGYDKNDE